MNWYIGRWNGTDNIKSKNCFNEYNAVATKVKQTVYHIAPFWIVQWRIQDKYFHNRTLQLTQWRETSYRSRRLFWKSAESQSSTMLPVYVLNMSSSIFDVVILVIIHSKIRNLMPNCKDNTRLNIISRSDGRYRNSQTLSDVINMFNSRTLFWFMFFCKSVVY